MADFIIKPDPKGELFVAQTDAARYLIVTTLKIIADPVLDRVGAELFRDIIKEKGLDYIEFLKEVH